MKWGAEVWATVLAAAALLLAGVVGCDSDEGETGSGGGSSTSSGAGGGGGGGEAGSGGQTSSGEGGEAGSGGGGGGTSSGQAGAGGSADCQALSAAIAAQTSGVVTCTTAVRLDYQSLTHLGFQIFCGPYAQVTEAEARATAQADTGFGQTGTFLSGPAPVEDELVFYEFPGDFGGVGIVNARNGLSVFGGSVIWMGTGDITYPGEWQPPEALGPDCIPEVNALPPPARGFDLETGQPLTATEIDPPLTEAWVTALPDGLWQGGYVFDAMVIMYPRHIGMLDPTTAEWLVLINSGWLE